ncbi:MAG: hypothetical protein DLM55_08485 [Acidimicrobiales bacterium]|nr:MAG: hypothetical protein DLM55_08485 [Acidimicrobiales bacterium]
MSVATLGHAGPWTIAEVLEFPEDWRYELIDGAVVMNPAPSAPHQRVSFRCAAALDRVVPSGFEVLEAVNVRIGSQRLLIPDVAVVSCPGTTEMVIEATQVALMVEIISPSSTSVDRLLKPSLYAAAGIKNFIRLELNSEGAASAVVYELADEVYREVATVKPHGVLRLTKPFGVEIALDALTLSRS